jgi:glycosyltransferase involved in cell wall biosynthesis
LKQAAGGTELLHGCLSSLVDLSPVNLIVSVCHPATLVKDKPNILWQHHSYDQGAVQALKDPALANAYDAIVFVSHWQFEEYRRRFPIPAHKCHVIQNAIPIVPMHQKPKDKLRLIYTSTPWRGLEVLLDAFEMIDRSKVELVIYSGTSIYGQAFYDANHAKYKPLYDKAVARGATHYEYATNAEIRQALAQAHILSYPNIWEETSCLAAIEALSAGCKVVTTSFGALPETCGTWADYVSPGDGFAERFAKKLTHAIDTFWAPAVQDKLTEQVRYYNQHWTWPTRRHEWESLLKSLEK